MVRIDKVGFGILVNQLISSILRRSSKSSLQPGGLRGHRHFRSKGIHLRCRILLSVRCRYGELLPLHT